MSEFAEWMDLLARAEGVADYGPIYRLDGRVEELLEGLGAAAREEGLSVLDDLVRLEAASLRASPSGAVMADLDGWPLFDPAGRAVVSALMVRTGSRLISGRRSRVQTCLGRPAPATSYSSTPRMPQQWPTRAWLPH